MLNIKQLDYSPKKSDQKILVSYFELGNDLIIIIHNPGPHLGAVSLSESYSRLDGSLSASVSTLTSLGHRDNELTSVIARSISKSINKKVAVLGGIHIDNITTEQLQEIKLMSTTIIDDIVTKFR